MASLEDVFNDGDVDDSASEEVVTEEVANEDTKTEEVKAAEPETVVIEEGSTAEPKTEDEPQSVPLTALMAERDKRQALQKQVDDFNAKKADEPMPDIFEDQTGYTDRLTQQMNQAMFNERANTSEFYARREYPDLDAKIEAFKVLADNNQALKDQIQGAVSPYHEMVDIVDKHDKLAKMDNIEEFEKTTRAEIEAKVRAEIAEEMKGKTDADKQLRDSIPTSLVSEASKGTVAKPNWAGQSPLSDIFGD